MSFFASIRPKKLINLNSIQQKLSWLTWLNRDEQVNQLHQLPGFEQFKILEFYIYVGLHACWISYQFLYTYLKTKLLFPSLEFVHQILVQTLVKKMIASGASSSG